MSPQPLSSEILSLPVTSNSTILFCFYLTLLFGFFINENSSGGAMQDFNHHIKIVFAFDANFIDSVSNYRKFNNNCQKNRLIL